MNIYKIKYSILFFVALACLSFSVFGADIFHVYSKLEQEGDNYFFNMTLENHSLKDITLYRNTLPWVNRPGVLELKAIVLNNNFETLSGMGRLENTAGTIILKPNKIINAKINLNKRFVDFNDYHSKSTIVILWIYRPKSPIENLDSHSGVLVLSPHMVLERDGVSPPYSPT